MSFLNRSIQLETFASRPMTAIVGEGVEFSELPILIGGDVISDLNVNIDLTDDSIFFDFSNSFLSLSDNTLPGSGSLFDLYIFSDSSGLLPVIQNVTIDNSQTSLLLEESDIEFTEDSISVDLGGLPFDTNTVIKLDVEFESDFVRFQNSNAPGAYLYATGNEANNIRDNRPDFVEEGIAFNAAIEPDDDLIPFYRFQSNQTSGAYFFVGEEERNNINTSPNFSDVFTEEGIAFYAFGAGANQGTAFSRFQNSDFPGTYLYATGDEADNIRNNLTNFIDEGVAFEV